MSTRHELALGAVLRCLRPLVRLLVREGVSYPALAAALKGVFVDAAQAELQRQGMKQTASALSLLSGVHRKDLRDMTQASARRAGSPERGVRLSLIGQIVGRWMAGRTWQSRERQSKERQVKMQPRRLPRNGSTRSFEALVASVSKDVRPRAVLDEMLRLGVVEETPEGVSLVAAGLAPRQGFDAMTEALAVNLEDHAAASVANLHERRNFLDQAIYVDEITPASAAQLQRMAAQAWQTALVKLMAAAEERCEADLRDVEPGQRRQRLRFGVYVFEDRMDDDDAKNP
jgi:Family of unknown function (DUF6502)